MIDKEMARKLLPLVHSTEFDTLLAYVKYRKEIHKEGMAIIPDVDAWRNMQGAYQELNLMENLRKWVEQDSKD